MRRSTGHKLAVLQILTMYLVGALPAARAEGLPSHEIAPAVIAAQGDTKNAVPACSSCHGLAGQGNSAAGFPRLAGLPAPYIERQLAALADGRRTNGIMNPVAKALTPSELAALAVYYSQLPMPRVPQASVDPETANAAELAEHGQPSRGLPGCVLCHGNGGVGVGNDFPPLAGQPAIYIANQLRAWRQHTRPPGPMGLMSSIANKMSDPDISAVSAYFAAQDPDGETKP